jgi:peptide/nickel transport system substrate-binding protein
MRHIFQSHVRFADPHVNSDDKNRLSILANVVEPLVRRDARGGFVPCLAKSWQVSEDARQWQFVLHDGVRFHNGSSLRAADVVANLTRIRDEDLGGELGTAGVYQHYLQGATFDARGDVVHVTLDTPFSELLDLIEKFPIVPQKILGEGLLPANDIVGTGAYVVGEVAKNRVVLERFDDCWHTHNCPEALTFFAQPDANARVDALLAGDAHIISDVPLARFAEVVQKARLVSMQSTVCVIAMFNLLSSDIDKRVRQALNYALDIRAIMHELHETYALPLRSPLTPLHTGFDSSLTGYGYDPDKARALLAEAGAEGLVLDLNAPTIHPDESPRLAELIAEQCAAVGVTVNTILHKDRPAYADMVRDKQAGDVCIFDSSPLSSYRVLREKFHSQTQGPWWQGYHNTDVDKYIDNIARTTDSKMKNDLYVSAQKAILEDAPWLFLYSPMKHWGMRANIFWQPTIDGVMLF